MEYDIKTAADIGLGAISILLWLRQGKTQQKSDKVMQDLATMVKDHDQRISSLESVHRPAKKRGR